MKKMGTTLTIPFVRRRSAGIYTCVATNQFGGEVKASIQVSVYGKIIQFSFFVDRKLIFYKSNQKQQNTKSIQN